MYFIGNQTIDPKAKEMMAFQRHIFPSKPYAPSMQPNTATTTATATKETQIFNFKVRASEGEQHHQVGGSSNPYAYEGSGINADLVKSVFSKKSTSGPSIMNWKRNVTVGPTNGKKFFCNSIVQNSFSFMTVFKFIILQSYSEMLLEISQCFTRSNVVPQHSQRCYNRH